MKYKNGKSDTKRDKTDERRREKEEIRARAGKRSEREPGNDPEEIRARKRGDQSEAGQGYRGAPL